MSIEEVERILDETQEAVEYQRVGARLLVHPHLPVSAIASLVNGRLATLKDQITPLCVLTTFLQGAPWSHSHLLSLGPPW
jgi:hypothetical protein